MKAAKALAQTFLIRLVSKNNYCRFVLFCYDTFNV